VELAVAVAEPGRTAYRELVVFLVELYDMPTTRLHTDASLSVIVTGGEK